MGIAGVLDVEHVQAVVHRRCADLGVKLIFDPRGNTACTDGKTITIPAIRQPVTQDQLDTLYGFVIHECGHHLRPEAFKILRSAQPPEHVCALYNILEDDGMERDRANEWRGDRRALSNMNDIMVGEMVDQWEHNKKNCIIAGTDWTAQQPEPIAALSLGQLSRLEWDHVSDVTVQRLLKALPDNVKELLTDLEKEGWVDRFRGTKTEHDTWDVAIDLAKRLYPSNEQKEYEKIRKSGHGMKDRKRSTKKDTMVDAQGKGDTAEDGKAQSDNSEGMVVHWKDAVLSEHKEWHAADGVSGSIGIDWTGMASIGDVVLMPLKQVNVVDLATEGHNYTSGPNEAARYMPNNSAARQFGNRIRRYLQSLARSKVTRHKMHGKLDRSSIIKLVLPPIEGGDYNKRIFYTQEKHTLKDTCIFVLTDWSGSMKGRKMMNAADASQRLVYVMERILKIPVALALFTNGETECDIGYVKKFGTRGLSAEQIALRFAKFRRFTSANNDADALNWAWHEIHKRNETRKILMVLSDGCPAGCWSGNSYDNLHAVVAAITKDKTVELYGVGIHSEAVATYYPNHKVLNKAEEINDTLFNLIRDGDKRERKP